MPYSSRTPSEPPRPDKDVEALVAENDRLNAQVQQLTRAQWSLDRLQDTLERERTSYAKISEISQRIDLDATREQLLAELVDFVIHELNFQRCAALRAVDERTVCVVANQGHDDAHGGAAERGTHLSFPPELVADLDASDGLFEVGPASPASDGHARPAGRSAASSRTDPIAPVDHVFDAASPTRGAEAAAGQAATIGAGPASGAMRSGEWRAFVTSLGLSRAVLVDLAPRSLRRDRDNGACFLVVGSTEERHVHHAAPRRGARETVLLRTIAAVFAGALRNKELYEEVLGGRDMLERRVRQRTDELERTNVRLAAALASARESERLKLEFLANVSHELRTPLNAIINLPTSLRRDFPEQALVRCRSCEALFEPDTDGPQLPTEPCPACGAADALEWRRQRRYAGDPERSYRHLGLVEECGGHLLRVVSDILDVSKLETGNLRLEYEVTTVRRVVAHTLAATTSQAERSGVALVVEGLGEDDAVHVDPVRVSQILINLVGNAIKFAARGTTVRVTVALDDGTWSTAVRDEGPGIADGDLPVIFESFRQGNHLGDGHTRPHGGSGLGLAISRQLARAHGGDITVESRVGDGSEFTLSLPRMRLARAASTSTSNGRAERPNESARPTRPSDGNGLR